MPATCVQQLLLGAALEPVLQAVAEHIEVLLGVLLDKGVGGPTRVVLVRVQPRHGVVELAAAQRQVPEQRLQLVQHVLLQRVFGLGALRIALQKGGGGGGIGGEGRAKKEKVPHGRNETTHAQSKHMGVRGRSAIAVFDAARTSEHRATEHVLL